MKLCFLWALGLATRSAAESLTLQGGIQSIRDQLGDLDFQGEARASGLAAGRKKFVESLLAGIQQFADPVDAGPILANVSNLLGEILRDLQSEANASQLLLDAITGRYANCPADSGKGAVDSGAIALSGANSTHEDCRDQESSQQQEMVTECQEITDSITDFLDDGGELSWRTDNGFKDCQMFDANSVPQRPSLQDGSDPIGTYKSAWDSFKNEFESRMSKARSYFSTEKEHTDRHHIPCKTKFQDWADQVVLCNGHQQTFHTAYCDLRTSNNLYCTDLELCYNAAIGLHNTEVGTQQGVAASRVADAKTVMYLKCLVDAMAVNMTTNFTEWKTACTLDVDVDMSDYEVTDPGEPTREICTQLPLPSEDGSWDSKYRATSSTNYQNVTDCS